MSENDTKGVTKVKEALEGFTKGIVNEIVERHIFNRPGVHVLKYERKIKGPSTGVSQYRNLGGTKLGGQLPLVYVLKGAQLSTTSSFLLMSSIISNLQEQVLENL